MNNLKNYLILLLLVLLTIPAKGANDSIRKDSAYAKLYQQYTILYDKTDKESEEKFSQVQNQMKNYFLQHNDLDGYYSICRNEVIHDNNRNNTYKAIQKANNILEDMQRRNVQLYHIVYEAMGNIYQSRGNNLMAQKYYTEAYNNSSKASEYAKMGIYFRLASIQMLNRPDSAQKWNELSEPLSRNHPAFRQAYYIIASVINFVKNDAEAFKKNYQEYYKLRKDNPSFDDTGIYTMSVLNNAMHGNYVAALEKLKTNTSELDRMERIKLSSLILQRAGNYKEALKKTEEYQNLVDSINTDMFFANLNEITADLQVAELENQSAKEKMLWMGIIMALGLVLLVILIVLTIIRRRNKRILIEKNEQLETALDMADEADKMKNSFIKNVTHEIRTPLNAIYGFTQVINNPNYELDAQDKQVLTKTINENVRSITKIVDDLLQISESESNDFYSKKTTIHCNTWFPKLLSGHSKQGIKMIYDSRVGTNFTINVNENGLRQIVNHLLENSLKFTEEGHVILSCNINAETREIIISISDTGIGIPADKRDRIFDRFYKVDQFARGIGLGLSVSKKVAQKMGGDLAIDPTYKNGTRIVLTLPIE